MVSRLSLFLNARYRAAAAAAAPQTAAVRFPHLTAPAGRHLPPFVVLCALDFAKAAVEKQWQGVRYFVQALRRMARPGAGSVGPARSGRTGPVGTADATNLAAPTIAARPPEDLGRTLGPRSSSRLLEPRSRSGLPPGHSAIQPRLLAQR